MIKIVPCVPIHFQAVDVLLESAFGGTEESVLVRKLRGHRDMVVERVALDDEAVVGHIAFSKMRAPFKALALAPVAVTPVSQGQGVGQLLCRDGIVECERLKTEAIFVLGNPEYYQRFGFSLADAKGFSSPYAGDYFMMLKIAGNLVGDGEVAHADAFGRMDG